MAQLISSIGVPRVWWRAVGLSTLGARVAIVALGLQVNEAADSGLVVAPGSLPA